MPEPTLADVKALVASRDEARAVADHFRATPQAIADHNRDPIVAGVARRSLDTAPGKPWWTAYRRRQLARRRRNRR